MFSSKNRHNTFVSSIQVSDKRCGRIQGKEKAIWRDDWCHVIIIKQHSCRWAAQVKCDRSIYLHTQC